MERIEIRPQPGAQEMFLASPADIESARVNFARLMPSTAERVVGFWQTRQSALPMASVANAGMVQQAAMSSSSRKSQFLWSCINLFPQKSIVALIALPRRSVFDQSHTAPNQPACSSSFSPSSTVQSFYLAAKGMCRSRRCEKKRERLHLWVQFWSPLAAMTCPVMRDA